MDLGSKNALSTAFRVSLVSMQLLSRAKRKAGRALDSAAMHADAKLTEFCTYLSGILFGLW